MFPKLMDKGIHSILITKILEILEILLTIWAQNSWLMGQKISNKALHTMDSMDPVF